MIDDLQTPRSGQEPAQPMVQMPGAGRTSRRPADEPHLLDYARVVVKRRHIAIASFLVVVLMTAVYSFTATPIYEGRAQLLIEADNPNVINFAEVINEAQTRQDYYQTQYRLLQSRSLAKKTIDTLQLWSHEELSVEAAEERFSVGNAMRGAAAWAASLFASGEAGGDGDVPGADESGAQAEAIDAFLKRLSVSPIRNSRLVEIAYRSQDSALAARVANTLAGNYIEQNLDFRFNASREASDWLNLQLVEQRRQVEAAEVALQQYRERNDAISLPDRENIVVQKLSDLNAAVTRAKTERLQKESMYRQLTAIQSSPAELDTFPAILGNQFIQQQKTELASLQRRQAQLGDRLGDRHPEMIQVQSAIQTAQLRIEGEVAKVVQSVRTEYQAAVAQEHSMTAALEEQKGEALTMNRRAIEYSVLLRDVESGKQVYDSLLQRAKETGISGELRTSNIRVVDLAEASRDPVSPRRSLNLLLALFGGGFLGIGLAFFFEYLDNRVKTPEEIEAQLGLPSIGLIPAIADPQGHANPLINNGVPANFAEAFRGLRTNILFSASDEGSRSIVVTSTGPSEGKTMVASNLAVGMAQAGQRVLIIDADMRRPRGHEVFEVSVEPGLSNLLVGAAKASEVVQATQVPNLWIIPAGKTPPNPAELLGSRRFADFLVSLKEQFDLVVVDTPPVMAVTDAAIVANRASGVLFVVAADTTSRQAAQQALDQLEHARARFVGAVLNRVDLQRDAYYYSRYYRKEYASYYSAATNG